MRSKELKFLQGPCQELPSVHVCSLLMSSGPACKRMPPEMHSLVLLEHCGKLCHRMGSGELLCLPP